MRSEYYIPAAAALEFDGLVRLLRANGFQIGVSHYLRLERVIGSLGSNTHPSRLASLLCPIFATNPQQQSRFYELFDDFFERRRLSDEPGRSTIEASNSSPRAAMRHSRKMWVIGTMAMLLMLAIGGGVLLFKSLSKDANLGPAAPVPTTHSLRLSRRMMTSTWLPAGAVLFLLAAFYGFYRRPSAVLRGRATRGGERATCEGVHEPAGAFDEEALRRTAREFRTLRASEAWGLDIEKTINRALRLPGHYPVVMKAAKRSVEYLILLDREYEGDHLSILLDRIFDQIRHEHVTARTYFFNGDPRICWDPVIEAHVHLSTLAARHVDSRVLLFTDGRRLVEPSSGMLEPWTSVFSQWGQPILFAPTVPPQRLGVLCQRFNVWPASLDAVAAALASEGRRRAWEPRQKTLAVREPDSPAELDDIRDDLGAELFALLCACAVYPRLDWDLTIFLGRRLGGPHIIDQQNLFLLFQLSWFREGRIPPEFRLALLKRLDPERRRAVAEMLSDFFDTSTGSADLDEKGGVSRFPVAVELTTTRSKRGRNPVLIRAFETAYKGLSRRATTAVRCILAGSVAAFAAFVLAPIPIVMKTESARPPDPAMIQKLDSPEPTSSRQDLGEPPKTTAPVARNPNGESSQTCRINPKPWRWTTVGRLRIEVDSRLVGVIDVGKDQRGFDFVCSPGDHQYRVSSDSMSVACTGAIVLATDTTTLDLVFSQTSPGPPDCSLAVTSNRRD